MRYKVIFYRYSEQAFNIHGILIACREHYLNSECKVQINQPSLVLLLSETSLKLPLDRIMDFKIILLVGAICTLSYLQSAAASFWYPDLYNRYQYYPCCPCRCDYDPYYGDDDLITPYSAKEPPRTHEEQGNKNIFNQGGTYKNINIKSNGQNINNEIGRHSVRIDNIRGGDQQRAGHR
ncbi:uncharacterized protein LOC111052668 [Nilaparvata lugens]|uniref:uncharacterized protein LOC111052668 n=1 Tax=Nilaparvata lugens TaxID=108931 RepID=UPI00193EA2AD|nr:uncharacterized protein LOC111052668 [Nilaparvata lugens]